MGYSSDTAWLRSVAKSGSFASTQPERVLARLLTMTKAPHRFGFEYLGGGYFGSVYSHAKTPGTVYKVCLATFGSYRVGDEHKFTKDASDGYAGWAALCAEYQQEYGQQEFLPHIKEIIHAPGVSIYVMDCLDECEEDEGSGWAMFFNWFFDTEDSLYDPDGDFDEQYDHPHWYALCKFRAWLSDRMPSYDTHWDIHQNNVMMRGKTPVLTDPWAHVHPNCPMATSLTRKLNKSVGITA